jgi:hypothetical protein
MPKQIIPKNSARESSTVRRLESEKISSKKQLVTITSENITSPEKSKIPNPYCKVCRLTRCACSTKKE